MDEQYGEEAVLLDRITDAAGVLSEAGQQSLLTALAAFEARFPQLFTAIYTGALPAQSSLRQFGFWLLNRAAVCGVDAARLNEHGALFIIDTHGRAAALILGYLPECYLSETDTARILQAGARAWQRSQWADGLLAALCSLEKHLSKRAAEAARHPGKFTPGRPPADPQPPRFRRLRQGHRKPDTAPRGTPSP